MIVTISARSMATLLVLLAGNAAAQSFDSMPEYRPQQQVSGIIRVAGDNHEKTMLANWEQEFHKYQPNVIFHNNLTSTVHGIPALVFDVADIGLLGREIAPLEDLSFRRMFRYEPFEIVTAIGSFDTQYEAFAIGVFVNKENPITRLTLPQLAAIFGCGPGMNTRTWGQLGLTGGWVNKPIHVFGYPTGNNIAAFFELKVFQAPPSGGPTLPNGARWNCHLKEFSNTYDANDKPVVSSDALMIAGPGQGLVRDRLQRHSRKDRRGEGACSGGAGGRAALHSVHSRDCGQSDLSAQPVDVSLPQSGRLSIRRSPSSCISF